MPAMTLVSSYLTFIDLNDVAGTANFPTLLVFVFHRNHADFVTVTKPVTDGSVAQAMISQRTFGFGNLVGLPVYKAVHDKYDLSGW